MSQFPLSGSSTRPRVQHIPADHPYVRHLAAPPGAEQQFIALPDPAGPARPGTWQPSPALDPDWVDAHADGIDVLHLHFGYEHLDATQVAAWSQALHRAGCSLVVTVHDLDNPHLTQQRRHHETVRAALAGADRVLTLTPGAAAEIERRWARSATVIAHPHVFPLELVGRRQRIREPATRPRVGIPVGAMRANVLAETVLGLWAGSDDVDLRVRVSRQVSTSDPTGGGLSFDDGVDRRHWQLDVVAPGEPELAVWQWLSALDAVVLPYGWGSHSGWAEAAADVGTSVIAPDLGFWAEQGDLVTVPPWTVAVPGDLLAAVDRLHDPADPAGGGRQPRTPTQRTDQRAAIHAAHAEVYRSC